MGQLSDRERLIRLIEERRERLRAIHAHEAEDENQAAATDDARRQSRELLKTQAVFERSRATFHEFPLEETGHILHVTMGRAARSLGPHGIEATGGVDFVLVCADHRDQHGTCTIPLLAARFRRGKYFLFDYEKCYLANSPEKLHDKMLQLVSEMDEGYMYIVVEKFRRVALQPDAHSSPAGHQLEGGGSPGVRSMHPAWEPHPGCGDAELRAVIGGHEPLGRSQTPRLF
jgi:hypothetical protein